VTEHGKYVSSKLLPPPQSGLKVSGIALQWGRGSLIDSGGENVTGEHT
jgi:hypothetical protein